MPYVGQTFNVTAVPQLIATGNADGIEVNLVASDANTFIGGPTVSITDGFRLPATTNFSVTLKPGDLLYAVHATTAVLYIGKGRQ